MHDALLVSCGDSIRKGNGDIEKPVQGEALPGQKLGEGLPLHQLHRDEVDAAVFFD